MTQPRARTAHLIAELYARLRRVGLTNSGAFACPMTQEQLADALGLTSVHVNRMLRALWRDGVIAYDKPVLSILDFTRLHATAGFEEAAYMG